jgi:hypothetical protein
VLAGACWLLFACSDLPDGDSPGAPTQTDAAGTEQPGPGADPTTAGTNGGGVDEAATGDVDGEGGSAEDASGGDAAPASSAGDAAVGGDGAAGAGSVPPAQTEPPIAYVDPGDQPWEPVSEDQVEEVCGLDLAALQQARTALPIPWAIVRHGRLCYENVPAGETPMTATEVFSTTKTMGATVVGIASHQTRDIPRSGRQTGQLSDWDRVDHWLDDFTYNPDAHVAHVLAMVGHNADLSLGAKQHAYDTTGDVQINSLSRMVNVAVAQDPARLGADIEEFTRRFLFEPLGMRASTWTGGASDKVFGYSWSASTRDMLRLGLLLLNRGTWNGQRVLAEEWVYKMTHPAFEDGNTGYGYLTWLSSRSNHSIGFSPPTAQGPNVQCAPAALWESYPHGELSRSPDCNYEPPYDCEQGLDVGVFQAVGFMGMLIQVHPGLDLVIAARADPLGGAGVWPALLPAVVNADPQYAGDQDAFCQAYAANEYAPDWHGPWRNVP